MKLRPNVINAIEKGKRGEPPSNGQFYTTANLWLPSLGVRIELTVFRLGKTNRPIVSLIAYRNSEETVILDGCYIETCKRPFIPKKIGTFHQSGCLMEGRDFAANFHIHRSSGEIIHCEWRG